MSKTPHNTAQLEVHGSSVRAVTAEDRVELLQERSELEKRTSIEIEVLQKIAAIAKTFDGPIILRSVNPDALPLLQRGAVGKNMAVHGKSSIDPMLAGYIPRQASISKAAKKQDPQTVSTAAIENEHSIEESLALIAQYRDTVTQSKADRPDELYNLQQKAVISVPLRTTSGDQIYIFEDTQKLARRDAKGTIFAVKEDERYYQIDENHNRINPLLVTGPYTPIAVEVFAKPTFNPSGEIVDVKPITADVDVLAYGSSKFNFDHNSYDRADVMPLIGQGPKILQELIKDTICPVIGRDIISHGPEQFNLDYPQPLEYPWVVVNPSGTIELVHHEAHLLWTFNESKNITPSPHWAWEKTDANVTSGVQFQVNQDLRKSIEIADVVIKKLRDDRKPDIRTEEQKATDLRLAKALGEQKLEVGLMHLDTTKSSAERQRALREFKETIEHHASSVAIPTLTMTHNTSHGSTLNDKIPEHVGYVRIDQGMEGAITTRTAKATSQQLVAQDRASSFNVGAFRAQQNNVVKSVGTAGMRHAAVLSDTKSQMPGR